MNDIEEIGSRLVSATTREKILELQSIIMTMPQCFNEPVHLFAPGLYARQLLIPAGNLIVGKIHKHAHINTISYGRILVSTEFGVEEYVGHRSFVSEPGTKRAVFALEDTMWTTYHPTNETDLAKIEDEVIAKSYDEYDAYSLKLLEDLL